MKVKVCVGSSCTLLGAMGILDQIEDLKDIVNEDADKYDVEELDVEAVKCLGFCKETNKKISPIVVIDDEPIFNATGQMVMEKIINRMRRQ